MVLFVVAIQNTLIKQTPTAYTLTEQSQFCLDYTYMAGSLGDK